MSSLAELRQVLKEDASGRNLYDHLTETLMKILLERPANAFDNFETISAEVKSNPLNPDPEKGKPLPPTATELQQQISWTTQCTRQLKVPDEPPEDSGVKYPDLLNDSALLEWAGLSLGKTEIYRLYLSIKKLAETLPGDVERLRFFGVFYTRGLPYFVVEGINPEEDENRNEKLQEGKAGANRYAYWVTQSPEASQGWSKLPPVQCQQIVLSRHFRRFLSGSLSTKVVSYPPFPGGTEAHYLRTLIARITASTSISPDGFFETEDGDDGPVVKPAENEALLERFPKDSSELKDAGNWKHHELEFNGLGRWTKLPEVTDEATGEPVELSAEEQAAAELSEPLAGVQPEAWAFRLAPGGAGGSSSSTVLARSMKWPGAVSIAWARRFLCMYVGFGQPMMTTPYSPPFPPSIQSEWVSGSASEGSEENAEATANLRGVMMENNDVRVDPTPPAAENPEGEE